MPDSQAINYLNETQRLALLTGDESLLQNHRTNFNETQQGQDQLAGEDLAESVMDKDEKNLTDFVTDNYFPSDNDEEEEEKKEKEGDVGLEEEEEEVKYLGGEDIRTKPPVVAIKQEDMSKVGKKAWTTS